MFYLFHRLLKTDFENKTKSNCFFSKQNILYIFYVNVTFCDLISFINISLYHLTILSPPRHKIPNNLIFINIDIFFCNNIKILLINNNYIYFVVLVKYNKILYPKAKPLQQF